jgi:hypothetical protein
MVEQKGNRYSGELDLVIARMDSGKPSSEEVSYYLKEELGILKNILEQKLKKDDIIEELSDFKRAEEKKLSTSVSRVVFCIGFVATIIQNNTNDKMLQSLDVGNLGDFRFLHDIEKGAALTLSSIFDAEVEQSGKGEESRLDSIAEVSSEFNLDMGDETELYLALKRNAINDAGYLARDLSGFSLADELVERLKTGTTTALIYDFESIKYISAGAELARDLYKQLYQISAPLYPQEQKK